jgi:hypothetical protein
MGRRRWKITVDGHEWGKGKASNPGKGYEKEQE